MPRRPVPISADHPYHISARCHNGEWFELPLPTVWSITEDYLYLMSTGFGVQIHSFTLMANHFHLVVSAPQGNLSEALLYFMRETSRQINRLTGKVNQVYGSRNHKPLLNRYHYFLNTYKYVYQNPLRANLVERVEDYPYTTLHGLCGGSTLYVPVEHDTLLFTPGFSESTLKWLNERPNAEALEEMRLALRKPIFSFPGHATSGNESLLETSRL